MLRISYGFHAVGFDWRMVANCGREGIAVAAFDLAAADCGTIPDVNQIQGLGDGHAGTYARGREVAPGITSIRIPGHTPGHGKDRIFVQSDVTNIPTFFLRHSDWHGMYDHDPELAQRTRNRFYDMAATERALVVGYQLVPMNWSTTT